MLIGQNNGQDSVEAESSENNNEGILTNNIHGAGLIGPNNNQDGVEESLAGAEQQIVEATEPISVTSVMPNSTQLNNNAPQHHHQNCTMNMLRRCDQRGCSSDHHYQPQRQHQYQEHNNVTDFSRPNITETNRFNSSHTFNATRSHEGSRANGRVNENRRAESIRKPWRRV